MPKQCKAEGCSYNVFGKGYCVKHQYLRTDKKPKPLAKISKKGETKLKEKAITRFNDKKFFEEIWNERPHFCENCNAYLGDEPLSIFFDHLLEKSTFPALRYIKENIMLLCWQDHADKTNGHPAPKVLERRDQIMKKYYLHKFIMKHYYPYKPK